MPDLRFEAGLAYSALSLDGVAGSASGSFPGYRMLATAGLTGNYRITPQLEFEPSMQVFALLETERAYIDSLGTAQSDRNFSTGRASVGAKWLYRSQWGELSVVPYFGLYGDYYFSRDYNSAVGAFARRRIAARDVRPDGRDGQWRPDRRWR